MNGRIGTELVDAATQEPIRTAAIFVGHRAFWPRQAFFRAAILPRSAGNLTPQLSAAMA
jgi:hypothetical protein